jgi:CRP-like cAMP-binding protein
MLGILFRKLEQFVGLPLDDRQLLELRGAKTHRYGAHADLLSEGSDPRFVNVVLEGWACRYKQLEDGRRQIIGFFLPGDMCDPCVFLLDQMSHTLATLTPALVARIPEADMLAIMRQSPTLNKALWFEMLVSAEVQREWTVSLGRRTAMERIAHLFCEMLVRLRAVGLADANGCDMPITQADLGDALGLSAVHVNRVLQELRALKLIDLRGRRLIVHDEPALQSLALFNPSYLHMQRHNS